MRGPSKYDDLPWRTHFRADDATAELTADKAVISVDNVRRDGYDYVVKGKRFHALTLSQVKEYYAKRHVFDRHLYESLRTGSPYKPMFDLDRAIGGLSPTSLADLQHVYSTVFLPLIASFFASLLGVPVDVGQHVRSLDASLEGRKFSKHLVLHLEDASGRLFAYHDRADEMSVISSLRQFLETRAESDDVLAGFYYFHAKGDVNTVVDYAIYHHGKRDMRMIGSCKASGKTEGMPLRTLMPERMHGCGDMPLCHYLGNVFGSPSFPIAGTNAVDPRKRKRTRGRRTARVTSAKDDDVVDIEHHSQTDIAAMRRVAVAAGGSAGDGVVKTRPSGFTVPVDYKAPAEGAERRCLFAVRHTRHWAEIRCTVLRQDGAPPGISRVEYYCHGCGTATALYNRGSAVERMSVQRREIEAIADSGMRMQHISTRYLPAIEMHGAQKETLVMKSGMGSGKTSRIQEYLDGIPSHLSVLCVGYRRVLNSALADKFGLADYQQLNPEAMSLARRLCVQLDSLPKLLAPHGATPGDKTLHAKFDVVIIDEVESTLDHFAAETIGKTVLVCWKLFAILVHGATKLIVADADAGARTLATIKSLRQESQRVLITNSSTIVSQAMCEVFVWMPSLGAFLSKVCEILFVTGAPVYLATNSKNFAHAFVALVLHYARTSRAAGSEHHSLTREDVLLIDRDVPEAEKRAVRECNTTWLSYKMVVCTPTVGAGIDFHIPNFFHSVFVHATDRSTSPREINQQRGRVRCPRDKRCYLLVDTHHSAPQPDCVEEIYEALQNRGGAVIDDLVEYQPAGTAANLMGIRLSRTPALLLRLFAIHSAEKNASYNNMRLELHALLVQKYPMARHVLIDGALTGTERSRAHQEVLRYKTNEAQQLVQQPMLSESEARALLSEIIAGEDGDSLFAKQRLRMHMLRRFYPGFSELSVSEVMTIGHQTFQGWVCYAAVLLSPAFQREDDIGVLNSQTEWTSLTTNGAAQFSLAHRAALEIDEPPHVTQAFFGMFVFFSGITTGTREYTPHDSTRLCRDFFDPHAVFHSAIATERQCLFPEAFESLRRYSIPAMRKRCLVFDKQSTSMVRCAFKAHLRSKLGIKLIPAGSHKHYAGIDGIPLRATTDCCAQSRLDDIAALGILECVRAHAPRRASGMLAGSLALQRVGHGVVSASSLPVVCEVAGVGLSSSPASIVKKPLRRQQSGSTESDVEEACVAALSNIALALR